MTDLTRRGLIGGLLGTAALAVAPDFDLELENGLWSRKPKRSWFFLGGQDENLDDMMSRVLAEGAMKLRERVVAVTQAQIQRGDTVLVDGCEFIVDGVNTPIMVPARDIVYRRHLDPETGEMKIPTKPGDIAVFPTSEQLWLAAG